MHIRHICPPTLAPPLGVVTILALKGSSEERKPKQNQQQKKEAHVKEFPGKATVSGWSEGWSHTHTRWNVGGGHARG